MVIYLDASVVLAHLFSEDRHPSDEFWDQELISSRLLVYEVWNRLHAHNTGDSLGDAAAALLGRVDLVEMSESPLERALDPFPVHVRTLDALHLATIEFLRGRRLQIELASYDRRLTSAAEAIGIPIHSMP